MLARNEIEKIVESIWKDILTVEQVEKSDDFFLLGGDSLLAIELATRISDELDIEIPLEPLILDGTYEGILQACIEARSTNDG